VVADQAIETPPMTDATVNVWRAEDSPLDLRGVWA
jgi:hypothetical protein